MELKISVVAHLSGAPVIMRTTKPVPHYVNVQERMGHRDQRWAIISKFIEKNGGRPTSNGGNLIVCSSTAGNCRSFQVEELTERLPQELFTLMQIL